MFDFQFQELPEYSSRLYARVHEGVIVPPAEVSLGDWQPLPNECHQNASTWCANTEGFTVVHGWLYFHFEGLLPFVLFNAHSVVRDARGQLWDITPNAASQPYPFLIAEESAQEYAQLVQSGATRLRHRR
jgi:hypothetical protein